MTKETYIGIQNVLLQIIKGTQWERHVYLVGGCVRDDILHHEIHDVDIAVDTPNGGVKFARWLEKKRHTVRGCGIIVFIHFGTAKVKLRRFPDEIIDCVQTRRDRYIYEKEPHPERNFGTVEEDAIRRDLTINSLYVDVSTGKLLDPTGMGLHDLEHHIIHTPNVPDITFTDNPMHVLRCIRFAAKYGWKLDETLFEDLKRSVGILAEATSRRMLKEVTAILNLEDTQREHALHLIKEIGAEQYVSQALEEAKQMKEAGISLDPPQFSRRARRKHTTRKRIRRHASQHKV